jgi:hypothetical protein
MSFNFSPEDLASNKIGELSNSQKQKLAKDGVVLLSVFTILSAGLGILIYLFVPDGLLIAVGGVMTLNLIGSVFFVRSLKANRSGKALMTSGRIQIDYRGKMECVIVNDKVFNFSGARQHFIEGKNYTIYYSTSNNILSFETN